MNLIVRILGRCGLKDPEEMNFEVMKTLVGLSMAMAVTFLAGNLAALKIWSFFGIPVDAGIILFPISYIVGDWLVEIYGEKMADLVAIYCSIFAVVVAATLLVAKLILPDYPGADNSAFAIVQSATGRIFLASVAGFISSQLLNNRVFSAVKSRQKDVDSWWGYLQRALASSAAARAIDLALFELLAFFGRLSVREFFEQAIFAYVAGVVLESLFSAALKPKTEALVTKLNYRDGRNFL